MYSTHGFTNFAMVSQFTIKFDVHRALHRNIISIAKLNLCTGVSNLFYFGDDTPDGSGWQLVLFCGTVNFCNLF